MAKMSPDSVNYRLGGDGQGQCGKCSMYTHSGKAKSGGCTLVAGPITPYGVCDRVAMMANAFGAMTQEDRVARAHRHMARVVGTPHLAAGIE
jgi:hypothetical protein